MEKYKNIRIKNIMQNIILLSLVVPVFNEQETIQIFIEKINEVFIDYVDTIKIERVFVNDGSSDNTLDILLNTQNNIYKQHNFINIKVIDFSRNFGKEAALSAGLNNISGDIIVPIDVDLQDPPELIIEMIKKWSQGFDVVLAKRSNRDSDSWAKKQSANWFYKLHNKISSPKIPDNVGDFRLMDKKVVQTLSNLPENHRFMKGLFAWVGFRTTTIEYSRPERSAGESKFNGWKLWNFALEGITSFSTTPLRIWTYVGSFFALLSFIFMFYTIIRVFVHGVDVPGYASIIALITFFVGLQLIGIGIIGEYLGRTYIESKRRPIYVIRKIYDITDDKKVD